MGAEDAFKTRPFVKIVKLLFVEVFINTLKNAKGYLRFRIRKVGLYRSSLIKDQKICNSVKGMIIGHFTVGEYRQYSSNFWPNKRMMNMVIERLKDQVQPLGSACGFYLKVLYKIPRLNQWLGHYSLKMGL